MSTQPSPARFIVPAVAFTLAAIVIGVVFTGGGGGPAPTETPESTTAAEIAPEITPETESDAEVTGGAAAPGPDTPGDPSVPSDDDATSAPPADDEGVAGGDEGEAAASAPMPPLSGLRAMAPTDSSGVDPASIGSLDPEDPAGMRIDFTRNGAGITRIAFADIWETAGARRQARAYFRAGGASQSEVEAPDEALRYILATERILRNSAQGREQGTRIPELAANQLVIDGQPVSLLLSDANLEAGLEPVWAETGPGAFETVIVDESGVPVLRIERRYELADNYDLILHQQVINLSSRPVDVRWWQYGPGDLREDRARYMDRRRYRFGVGVPGSEGGLILQAPKGSGGLIEHQSIEKRKDAAIWPTENSQDRSWDLSWFAVTNRYFGFAVHPPMSADGSGAVTLTDRIERVVHEKSFAPVALGEKPRVEEIFTYLASPERTLAPGESFDLDLGVFAGPLDKELLGEDPRYQALKMDGLILYQMSSFCAVCTFQWLARLLLGFLDILHDNVLFDWGLAIIVLVVVVRSLLHPITKKSQVGMQRFGKAMGAMKPEIEKLQKKYKDDPKRMQMEQVRLMREHGVSPMQALGCLPMFLQTPIWIALYAMLYFAFDIRQEAAFFGIFQTVTGGSWSFLADLSSGDHFFFEFEEPRRVLFLNVTGGNLLPLLLGAVFYFQQKYMTPPTAATLSPEQQTQQKIIKFMMVVLFPIFLYSAPSGLVLYIITSSCIGIIESRYIRRHVELLDTKKEEESGSARTERVGVDGLMGGKRKAKDAQTRAYNDALDARRQKAQEDRANKKKFKRRK